MRPIEDERRARRAKRWLFGCWISTLGLLAVAIAIPSIAVNFMDWATMWPWVKLTTGAALLLAAMLLATAVRIKNWLDTFWFKWEDGPQLR